MNASKQGALAALVGGLALVGFAVARGEVHVALLLLVPVVYGTGVAATSGMLLLMAAGILWVIGGARDAADRPEATPRADLAERAPDRRGGGVVLLGPIPIVWGDARVRPWLIAIGLLFLLLFLLVSWSRR